MSATVQEKPSRISNQHTHHKFIDNAKPVLLYPTQALNVPHSKPISQ
jgi:hypothetical protein